MSLTSKDDITNYLVLDLGIYPSSDELRKVLKNNKQNHILELNPNQMKSADWDHVLELVIKNKKCITL